MLLHQQLTRPPSSACGTTKLYHGTSGEFAGSIGKKGLLSSIDGRLGPGVYFTPDEQAAWRWAKWNQHPYVLTCEVPSDQIMRRAEHPGYPDQDMPPFAEVLVRNESVIKIVHVKGFVDHKVDAKEERNGERSFWGSVRPLVPEPDPDGRPGGCHLRQIFKKGSNGLNGPRCTKCNRLIAPFGEWVCKCGKCINCQPDLPDFSLQRDDLVGAGLSAHVIERWEKACLEDGPEAKRMKK